MLADLRFAFRLLLKQPGFTAVAVLTMAVAIGANTALFSVINAVVLRPIDYPQPDQLVRLWDVSPARGIEFPAVSLPRYRYFRDHATLLANTALSVGNAVTITDGGDAEQVPSLIATANFFPTLGLQPQLGRFFSADEDRPGGANVVLISQHLWESRFGGAPGVLGRKITLDGVPCQVIGVLPAVMPVPFNQVDLIQPRPEEVPFVAPEARDGGAAVWQMTARLKPGVTREAAERQLRQLDSQLREKNPQFIDAQYSIQLRQFADEIIPSQLRLASWVLVAAVVAVLLIACANIANLSLARLTTRSKEIAVRASLGAARTAIVRQFLVESLVVAAGGAVLGVLLASWGLDGIRLLAAQQLPRIDRVSIDGTTLLFALGATTAATLLVGLYPAWQATRTDVQTVLKDTGRGTAGSHANKLFRSALVIGEVAASLVLLIGAALLLYSFARLQHTAPGFVPDRVAVGTVNLPPRDYPTPEKQREFVRQLQGKLDAAPELQAAGVGFGMPLTNSIAFTPYSVDGRPILPIPERPLVGLRQVTPGFFRALGITAREGRLLAPTDEKNTPMVGVINESLAKKLFPHERAVGHFLRFGAKAETRCEIVGVIGDVKSAGLAAPAPDEIYFAHSQRGNGFFHVVGKAKPGLSAAAVIPVLRRTLRDIDPGVALATPQTADELIAQDLQAQKALSLLLGAFAALAALLAAVGIYSVIAYNVSQRRSEIGVRMALGATTRSIFQLVLKNAGTLVGLGMSIGLLTAIGASRILRQLLFEVQPFDPLVFAVVVAGFTFVGILAAVIPARRAMAVDPVIALRAE
ncbi:MAG TPA: ABC transporter permease [Opitutaceae bacterium]|nr:ABC transporter permease [Opitutaceae bacterium]